MTGTPAGLAARIAGGHPVILDGALGTELERRGARCDLPLWSARALLRQPERVFEIHADYVAAGAEVLTADTFRTQRRTLSRAGLGDRAVTLTADAVALARRAAEAAVGRRVFVAGSAPTLEDCYRPDLVPPDDALAREHAEHASNLAQAGVDAILVETMNTKREALAAARAARATGLPVLVSFVCDGRGRLLDGELLGPTLDAVRTTDPIALLVNCVPPSAVAACLPALRAGGRPFGVYPNLGEPVQGGRSEDLAPDAFAALADGWIEAGARLVGGCCGTTPAHVRSLASVARRARSRTGS